MKKTIVFVLSSLIVGGFIGFLLKSSFDSKSSSYEPIVGAIEHEITEEDIAAVYGDLETFGECELEADYFALQRRFLCNKKAIKASKSFRSISAAEREVKRWLEKQDIDSLVSYTSCEANDLTWYELHCEADLVGVDKEAFRALFTHLNSLGESPLKSAVWKRERPLRRDIRNPRWRMRSRLISKNLSLEAPWDRERHPTENGTIILIEQKLDGKIYVVGIPITGLSQGPTEGGRDPMEKMMPPDETGEENEQN